MLILVVVIFSVALGVAVIVIVVVARVVLVNDGQGAQLRWSQGANGLQREGDLGIRGKHLHYKEAEHGRNLNAHNMIAGLARNAHNFTMERG
jgi:hypothetical protein